jgi:acyl carrier protein
MSEVEIKEAALKVLRKIAPEADLAKLGRDENLREALDIDSFDFLQFVIGLHESLDMEIPESDYPQLATLAGILNYAVRRRTPA